MTVLKSKTFWAITGAAGTAASALGYDKYETRNITQELLEEAALIGMQPSNEDEPDRRISLIIFGQNKESIHRQKALFRDFSVKLLTRAGVDYQWVEFDGAELDKKYYKLKEDEEVQELPDGKMPENETKIKPSIFDENMVIESMMNRWMNRLNNGNVHQTELDPIRSTVLDESIIDPADQSIFTDGVISTNVATYRAIMSAFKGWKSRQSPLVEPNFGLINCEYPSTFLWRLYWVLIIYLYIFYKALISYLGFQQA